MKRIILTLATVLMIGAAGAVWAQHGGHGSATDEKALLQMVRDMMLSPKDSPSTRAYKEAHLKMMKAMHIAYTGNADVDFARGMIAHHQGAIDMANIQLRHGKDPEIQKLSREIVSAQESEISFMSGWLKKHSK